jgi:hypothetical protein
MRALKILSMPKLRKFALAALAATTLGLAAATPAWATTPESLPTRKQVCYLDPVKGKVCQWVWVWPGIILPKAG